MVRGFIASGVAVGVNYPTGYPPAGLPRFLYAGRPPLPRWVVDI